jgi:mannose-6-phosphate isomerase-like protein (cupin superfamily)
MNLRALLFLLLYAPGLISQDGKVDPTWLHRSIPVSSQAARDYAPERCEYVPVFGVGDAEARILRTVSRFAEVALTAGGNCPADVYDRQEEIYFVLQGSVSLRYADQVYELRTNDFTYLPPGIKHSIANASQQTSRVLVMGFRIPPDTSIRSASAQPKIVNLNDVKEETVDGHPASVLYRLLLGPRAATRDAIDDAYVVTSLFWMNFAPGGTNLPHHHETAEEIYLVMDGEGEIVAGSGVDGIEGRYPAKAGDAYYFRPNCTVGFYNQNKPDARAHILAVRARISLPDNDD